MVIDFFSHCSYFSNKLTYIFFNNLYRCNQWANLNQLSGSLSINKEIKLFGWWHFLCLVHIFLTQSVFSKLNIISKSYIFYVLTKTRSISENRSDFNLKLKKKIIWLTIFSFYYLCNFFVQMSFYVLKFWLKTYKVIFHSPKGNSKS